MKVRERLGVLAMAVVLLGGWGLQRATGARAAACGDAIVDPGEHCDPPESSCTGAFSGMCQDDCTCPEFGAPLPHFLCHKTRSRESLGSPQVSLVDGFGATSTSVVAGASAVCLPADKDHEDPSAQADARHLVSYKLAKTPFSRVSNLTVTDEFGELSVDVLKPAGLLVPTAQGLLGPPGPLTEPTSHFSCYKVRRSPGAPRFRTIRGVTLDTQLATDVLVDVVSPQRLCTPVNKNGEEPGAEKRRERLMCYRIRTAAPDPATSVYLDNQFGQQTQALGKPGELCVPADAGPALSVSSCTEECTDGDCSAVPPQPELFVLDVNDFKGCHVCCADGADDRRCHERASANVNMRCTSDNQCDDDPPCRAGEKDCEDTCIGYLDVGRQALVDKGICAAADVKLVSKVSDCTAEVASKYTAAGNAKRRVCLLGHGTPASVSMGCGDLRPNGKAAGERDRLDSIRVCTTGAGSNAGRTCETDADCDDDPPCDATEADCAGTCAPTSSRAFFIDQLAGKVERLVILACLAGKRGTFARALANGLGARVDAPDGPIGTARLGTKTFFAVPKKVRFRTFKPD
jgi:hypothetical protein